MSETTSIGKRKRGLGRIAGLGSAGAAFAVMAMMLLVPVSAGAGASGLVSIPIKHFGVSTSYSVSNGACGKVKQFVAPHWSGTTFLAGTKAMAPKCKTSASQNFAAWDAYVNLQTPIHFKTSGSHTISVSWAVTESAAWNITPFSSCALKYADPQSYCEVYSDVFVTGYAYLVNANYSYDNFVSGSGFSNFTDVENYSSNYCYTTCTHYGGNTSSAGGTAGTFTGTGYQNETISATGTYAVNASVAYTLYVTLLVIADVAAEVFDAHATGAGSASAVMNLGTLGNGAALVGVTVT
ncbi:MAG: hypothetical protein L3K19_04360 [Thermoplasmata archaeon]|nr:hypothetical protein [Thermoplasmata archaeon]